MINQSIRIFGEVLFDQFPDGQRILGGAPFNVAWHLQAFNQSVDFISRVGNDEEGLLIERAMRDWGMRLENLQCDPHYATGRVQVSVSPQGEPEYAILADQAYDFISADHIQGSDSNTLLYHGTLALRQPCSALALEILLAKPPTCLFVDVNLRSPWWQLTRVQQVLKRANWAKLNYDELMQLQPFQGTLQDAVQRFRTTYQLDVVIVTSGEQGAVAMDSKDEFFQVVPTEVECVVDTVGAGDAFSAVVLLGIQHNWPLLLTLQRAQAFASAMVGQRGATIQDLTFYQAFARAWQLA